MPSAQEKEGKGKKGGGRGVNSCDEEDDDDDEDADDQSMGMLGLASLEKEDESDIVRVRGKWVPANPRDLDICMFEGTTVSDSEDEDDNDEDDNNEEDERRDELTEAIEKQLASRRAIEKEVAKEEEAKDEEWRAPKRPVKKSAQIRGTPLTEAYMNPFASIAEKIEIDSSSESILDRHLKRMGAATATSSISSPFVPPSSPCAAIPSSSTSPASPGTLSSISPIRTSSGKAQEAVHHRLDTSIDSPPGLEGITIRINGMGSESVFIMGKIVNESQILASMPMSITSSPGVKIDKMKNDMGTSNDNITEEFNEIVDTLAIGSADSDSPIDPDDYVYNIGKVDDTGIFPISVPLSNIRRSKSRRRKLRKKIAMANAGCTYSDCQDCQTPDFGDRRAETAPSSETSAATPSPAATSTTTSASTPAGTSAASSTMSSAALSTSGTSAATPSSATCLTSESIPSSPASPAHRPWSTPTTRSSMTTVMPPEAHPTPWTPMAVFFLLHT